jgi:hypothetical protein
MYRAFVGLVGAMLASAGCGGEAASVRDAPESPEAPQEVLEATPARPSPSAIGDESASVVDTACPMPPPLMPPDPIDPAILSSMNPIVLVATRILDTLAQYCGNCHGRADDDAPVGVRQFTNDFDRMVKLGVIIPLRSDLSPLLGVMRDGSMPPPCVQQRPTASDIEGIGQFIDNPRFWP